MIRTETICSTRGISTGTGCSGPTCPYWSVSAASGPVRCTRPASKWPPRLCPSAPRHLWAPVWTSETCPVCAWSPSSREFATLKTYTTQNAHRVTRSPPSPSSSTFPYRVRLTRKRRRRPLFVQLTLLKYHPPTVPPSPTADRIRNS